MHSSKGDNTRWLAWDLEMGRPRQKTRRCIGRRHLLMGKRWLAQWRWTALKRVLHRVTSFGVFLPVSCVVTCQWYADNYARCALWTWCMNVLEATIWVVARKSPAERHVLRSGSPTWPDCIAETLAESLVFQCLRTLYMLRFAVFCYANRCFLHFLRFPTL